MEKGLKEGIKLGIEKVVVTCIEKGFDDEAIQTITGLDIEKIKEIRNQKK
jgi:hypothetical protein